MAVISSNICVRFSSPSGTPVIHMLVWLMVSYRSLVLSSFPFIPFSFCSSDWKISVVLASVLLNLPSVCSICCVTSPVNFLKKFSAPQILFGSLLKNNFISLLIVSIYSNKILLIFLSSFSVVSFSSWSIFKWYA